jgi:NAD(P)-dependent dehydrogenase (short-subunit alcohol dehydrogenase family)
VDLQLAGKAALVTGGTKGIGRAVVEALQAIERDNRELFDAALALNPTGRMGTAEETAYAVVMLASPRASRITGTNLVVDGALTRGVQL